MWAPPLSSLPSISGSDRSNEAIGPEIDDPVAADGRARAADDGDRVDAHHDLVDLFPGPLVVLFPPDPLEVIARDRRGATDGHDRRGLAAERQAAERRVGFDR